MATDQGKTSNMNALDIVAQALGRPIPQVGLTTFRMPYTPVTFGAFAGLSRGDLFDPVRTTPIHGWAAEQGAVFEDVGLWKRARYFPKPDDVGLSWAVGKAKRDFVGKRSLGRPAMVSPGRKQLVGLLTADPDLVLEKGAQILILPNEGGAGWGRPLGHVTSSYFNATLGRSIALAMGVGFEVLPPASRFVLAETGLPRGGGGPGPGSTLAWP